MLSLLSAVLLVTLTLAPAGPEPRGRVRRAERIDAMLTDPGEAFCEEVPMLTAVSALLVATSPAPRRAALAYAAAPSGSRDAHRADPHVRGSSTVADALDGTRRSYTFARILEAIEEMDLIVYIVSNTQMPATLAGRLMVVPAAHEQRYVRIEVARQGTTEETIATIAHELQHAMEVASAPEVRDDEGLAALYKRIGHGVGGKHAYDTAAARDVGRTVRSELG